MFTVILEDKSGKELLRFSRIGNESYLLRQGRDFPLLSQLDSSSYDVFSGEQAGQLHKELLSLLGSLRDANERQHVQDLAQLALRAANVAGSRITVTPFSKPE
jgi:hypothetical protein